MELREFLISDAYVVTAQILSFISFGEAHFCLFVFRICICFFVFSFLAKMNHQFAIFISSLSVINKWKIKQFKDNFFYHLSALRFDSTHARVIKNSIRIQM